MPAPMPAPGLLRYSGTLLRNAECRSRIVGDVATSPMRVAVVPVLCIDIALDDGGNPMHIEQPFATHHTPEQAAAAARRLKKGMHISVDIAPQDIRYSTLHAQHIHTSPTL